jgi:BON domain
MNLRSLPIASLAVVLGLASTSSPAVAQSTGSTSTSSGGSGGLTSSGSSSGVGSGSGIGTGSSSGSSGTTGSTSPFVGNVAAGFGTQSTAGMTTTGSSAATAPTASNPFQATYVNPYAVGVAAGAATGTTVATKAFGTASVFTATTTAKYNTGSSNIASVTTNAGQGFTTLTLPRSIQYATSLSEDVPLVAHVPSAMQGRLSEVLARSSMLPDRGQMRVDVQGNVVVLSGRAKSDRERQLAERIVRLEPGVTEVRNRIVVPGMPNPNLPSESPTSTELNQP